MKHSDEMTPEDRMTPAKRLREIAAIFARAVLRLRKLQNRLEFSHDSRLTGVGSPDPNETGRQSADNTLPALTTTHPYERRARHG